MSLLIVNSDFKIKSTVQIIEALSEFSNIGLISNDSIAAFTQDVEEMPCIDLTIFVNSIATILSDRVTMQGRTTVKEVFEDTLYKGSIIGDKLNICEAYNMYIAYKDAVVKKQAIEHPVTINQCDMLVHPLLPTERTLTAEEVKELMAQQPLIWFSGKPSVLEMPVDPITPIDLSKVTLGKQVFTEEEMKTIRDDKATDNEDPTINDPILNEVNEYFTEISTEPLDFSPKTVSKGRLKNMVDFLAKKDVLDEFTSIELLRDLEYSLLIKGLECSFIVETHKKLICNLYKVFATNPTMSGKHTIAELYKDSLPSYLVNEDGTLNYYLYCLVILKHLSLEEAVEVLNIFNQDKTIGKYVINLLKSASYGIEVTKVKNNMAEEKLSKIKTLVENTLENDSKYAELINQIVCM